MAKYPKMLAALLITAIVASMVTFDPIQREQVERNVTSIQKTNLHWPAKGAISVDPCRYRTCTDV